MKYLYNFYIHRMKKEEILRYDYYALLQKAKANNIIELLNDKILYKITTPSINLLVEAIYEKLTTGEMKREFNSLMIDEISVNNKIINLLSKDLSFQKIDDSHIRLNLFTNAFIKLCRRIFLKDGHNDEKYTVQTYVHEWLEDLLANKITADNRFKSLESINLLLDQLELLHVFYSKFAKYIPEKWIDSEYDLWVKPKRKISEMLEYLRPYEKDYFDEYEMEIEKFSNLSKWNFTLETTRSSDHFSLNSEVSFISTVLFHKSIDKWLVFWDNLKFPILQDLAFHYFYSPENLLKIFSNLKKNKNIIVSDKKVLAYILLKNLFKNSLKVTENIYFYSDLKRINSLSKYEKNDSILSSGKRIFRKWNNEKNIIYLESLRNISEILTIDEISEWIFSYQPTDKSFNKINLYNQEIETVVKAYKTYFTSINLINNFDFIQKDFNLQKFNFIVSTIDSKSVDDKFAEKLLGIISNYINSEDFYWDQTFSHKYWEALKGIGKILSWLKTPIETTTKWVNKYKVVHEGWNINVLDYKLAQRESFVFCGAIFLLEHKVFMNSSVKNNYFQWMVDIIVKQSRYTHSDINFSYKAPLFILYHAANQIMPVVQKKYFEEKIISNIDNLENVINIFSVDNFPISRKSLSTIQKRIAMEYSWFRNKMTQTKQIERLNILEESLIKLKIST